MQQPWQGTMSQQSARRFHAIVEDVDQNGGTITLKAEGGEKVELKVRRRSPRVVCEAKKRNRWVVRASVPLARRSSALVAPDQIPRELQPWTYPYWSH
jgi:hypothetical protein